MTIKTYIIAEAAQGYEGSVSIAKLLIKAAAGAKADAIKFQVVYTEDLCEKDYEYYDLFKQLELSQEQWQNIRNFSKENDLDFIVDIFGGKSFEVIKNINVDGIKLHSTNFFDDELTANVLSLNKTTYLSVGGIKDDEIMTMLTKHNITQDKATILFGFQSEPTPIDANNLLRIQSLRDKTNLNIGFMDHSKGGSQYNTSLSALALGLGVRVFEKHISLDRAIELEDYISALTPTEFINYVSTIKNLPLALGSSALELNENELTYRNKVLKKVVATKDIDKGITIQRSDIHLSRPSKNSGCFKIDEVLGKTAANNITAGSPINQNDLL